MKKLKLGRDSSHRCTLRKILKDQTEVDNNPQGLNFKAGWWDLHPKFTKSCWKESQGQKTPALENFGFPEIFTFIK